MSPMGPNRFDSLQQWVRRCAGASASSVLEPVSADASSRRFYRVHSPQGSTIAIDSPPQTENNEQYVRLSRFYLEAGLRVPEVLQADLEAGFLLVSDLGTELMHGVIEERNADALYTRALKELIRIQQLPANPDVVPPYERERFEMEVSLFSEWLLIRFLGLELAEEELALIASAATMLVDELCTQPKVCVHRDFHSRNLVIGHDGEIGIVDFQDSLIGPYAYDPASLLRDCYLCWPEADIQRWAREYHRRALDAGLTFVPDLETFLRDLDLAAVQRHLKAVGIFARLYLRDARKVLLGYIAPVLRHVIRVGKKRRELASLGALIERRVLDAAERRTEALVR